MNNKTIIKYALAHGLWTVFYVICVAMFMSYASQIFGQQDTAFSPVVALLLLVFSAALCGSLVFGRPILWYIDGKKHEAVRLFAYTLGTLFVMLLLAFVVLYSIR